MAVRKRDGRLVIEFMFKGQRVFRRLPAGTGLAVARTFESRLRDQLFAGTYLGQQESPLISKLIEEWLIERVKGRKSEKTTSSHANRVVLDCLEGARLSSLADTREDVIRHGRNGGLSSATINRRLCILKAVAKYAYQKGYVQENLSGKIQLLPENNARHVYLSPEQVEALIKAIPDFEAQAFVAIAAFTGLRQGEVMALKPGDITPDGLVVRDSKIGKPRIVPYVGPGKYLKAIPFKSHKRTLYAAFEAARSDVGLPTLRYHDLRHTTASALINSGAELYTVGRVLGHKSQQTTARYAHLSVERQREALEKAFNVRRVNARKRAA